MNLDTDLWKRRALTKKRIDMGLSERAKLRAARRDSKTADGELYAIDLLPIKFVNVKYIYPQPIKSTKDRLLLKLRQGDGGTKKL